MKLYKGISKLIICRNYYYPKSSRDKIKWGLSLKVGDYINGCSGFNAKIVEIIPQKCPIGSGWFIGDIDFQFENGGYCSLLNCGVEPSLSREQIEKNHLEYLDWWLTNKDGAANWYQGLDNPKYQIEIQSLMKTWEALKAGVHICNEQGELLKEFEKQYDKE